MCLSLGFQFMTLWAIHKHKDKFNEKLVKMSEHDESTGFFLLSQFKTRAAMGQKPLMPNCWGFGIFAPAKWLLGSYGVLMVAVVMQSGCGVGVAAKLQR